MFFCVFPDLTPVMGSSWRIEDTEGVDPDDVVRGGFESEGQYILTYMIDVRWLPPPKSDRLRGRHDRHEATSQIKPTVSGTVSTLSLLKNFPTLAIFTMF